MEIAQIAKRIEANGGRLYLVGGAVRDWLMKLPQKDSDYCVVGLSKERFQQLFPHAKVTGQSFPVFRMPADGTEAEFAMARKERKVGLGHTGFEFDANESITLEQDLSRRDLTINAIAKDVLTDEVFDPFHGQSDLLSCTLRAVSDAFCEDPLRVYRAARFAAQLSFRIHADTIRLMNALKDELSCLSPERVFEELRKALRTKRPSIFFRALREARVLDVHFPELDGLVGVLQPPRYHPEGDAFEHTMQCIDAVALLTDSAAGNRELMPVKSDEVRFSTLLHDVGKGVTPPYKWPSHRGHEKAGVPLVESLCSRLKVPATWVKSAKFATQEHMRIHNLHATKPEQVVDLLTKADRNPLSVEGFALVGLADMRGRNHPEAHCKNAETMPNLWEFIRASTEGNQKPPDMPGAEYGRVIMAKRADAVVKWRQKHRTR